MTHQQRHVIAVLPNLATSYNVLLTFQGTTAILTPVFNTLTVRNLATSLFICFLEISEYTTYIGRFTSSWSYVTLFC